MDEECTAGVKGGAGSIHSLGDKMEGIIGRVRSHAVGTWEGGGSRGGGEGGVEDPPLAVEELGGEAEIRVGGGTGSADTAECIVKGERVAPHEVSDNDGGGT